MKPWMLVAVMAYLPTAVAADVVVSDGWARASVLSSRPAAAYPTLTSDREDQLVGVTSPVARRVTLHAVETDARGLRRMVELKVLNLRPGETVILGPGGMHLMLIGLSGKLEEGAVLPLTLTFASGTTLEVSAPVLGPGASGPQSD